MSKVTKELDRRVKYYQDLKQSVTGKGTRSKYGWIIMELRELKNFY